MKITIAMKITMALTYFQIAFFISHIKYWVFVIDITSMCLWVCVLVYLCQKFAYIAVSSLNISIQTHTDKSHFNFGCLLRFFKQKFLLHPYKHVCVSVCAGGGMCE